MGICRNIVVGVLALVCKFSGGVGAQVVTEFGGLTPDAGPAAIEAGPLGTGA